MENRGIAIVVGLVGLVGMFLFPSPEENFLYYVGFVSVIVGVIVFVLRRK